MTQPTPPKRTRGERIVEDPPISYERGIEATRDHGVLIGKIAEARMVVNELRDQASMIHKKGAPGVVLKDEDADRLIGAAHDLLAVYRLSSRPA